MPQHSAHVIGVFFLLVSASSIGCQRATTPTQTNLIDNSAKIVPLLIVKGALFRGYDTLNAVRRGSITYTTRLANGKVENVYDTIAMPLTGRYRVRLRANQLYQAAIMSGKRNIETTEFQTPASIKDSVLSHDFYLGYE
jgi:hypothetical protein